MRMQIIIPTKGRVNRQLTVTWFSKAMRKRTSIVCPRREGFSLEALGEDLEIVRQPDPEWTIARKRKWILEEWQRRGYEKIIMLDDDLRFATRVSDDDWHLREISGEELEKEFDRLEEKLGPEFPHVGFGTRQGNNQLEEVGWKSPGKMVYSLAYYLPLVLKEADPFILETREDMILSLQLLLKGYPNAVYHTTVVDQREMMGRGGASSERTLERSDADAERMAQMFAGYVSVVNKKYKSSVPRKEVIVQWKRALEDGQRKRAAGTGASADPNRSGLPSESN